MLRRFISTLTRFNAHLSTRSKRKIQAKHEMPESKNLIVTQLTFYYFLSWTEKKLKIIRNLLKIIHSELRLQDPAITFIDKVIEYDLQVGALGQI